MSWDETFRRPQDNIIDVFRVKILTSWKSFFEDTLRTSPPRCLILGLMDIFWRFGRLENASWGRFRDRCVPAGVYEALLLCIMSSFVV